MFNKLKKNTSMDMDEIKELLSDLSRKREKKRIFVWTLIVISILTAIIGVRWFLLKRNEEDYEDECSCDVNETIEDEDEKEELDKDSENPTEKED